MYFDYLRERDPDTLILEKEHGFTLYKEVTYREEIVIYIQDIYVTEEYRKTAYATEMSNEISNIAKKRGIKYLLGSVVPSTNNATRSIEVLIAHGMRVDSSEEDLIWFLKEI